MYTPHVFLFRLFRYFGPVRLADQEGDTALFPLAIHTGVNDGGKLKM